MVRYMEVWSYVYIDIPQWKEEWETMDDAEFICLNCGAKFSTNASLKFHCMYQPDWAFFVSSVNTFLFHPSSETIKWLYN